MSEHSLLYVGTYTWGKSEGIYAFRMDPETSALTATGASVMVENPAFVAADPTGRFLYAVAETGPEGAVWAFRIEADDTLTAINSQPSHGSAPCHLSVDASGKAVVVANYSSGTVAAYPVREDGGLGEAASVIRHHGSGPNAGRQEGPHAHSANIGPGNGRVYVADLGTDKVMIYGLDAATGKLARNDPAEAGTHAGAGPRHMAFHPNGQWAYVINELDSTMAVFAYDAMTGALEELQHLSTLPEGYGEETYCADVHVHPSGRFVYGSNRGHDSIAVFAVDQKAGRLGLVACDPSGGKTPRNFAITPDGRFVLAANQDSDSIVHYRVDESTGRLTATGQVTEVPAPVCVCFVG
jgi:6-phosphogluconolactonase